MQPPSKAETNITDAKEDNSYQEKQSYQQEVNTTSTCRPECGEIWSIMFISVHLWCDIWLLLTVFLTPGWQLVVGVWARHRAQPPRLASLPRLHLQATRSPDFSLHIWFSSLSQRRILVSFHRILLGHWVFPYPSIWEEAKGRAVEGADGGDRGAAVEYRRLHPRHQDLHDWEQREGNHVQEGLCQGRVHCGICGRADIRWGIKSQVTSYH